MRSGVFRPPARPATYTYFFLTLTAPSFGRVHSVPAGADATTACTCGQAHTVVDTHLRGVPLDPATYRYGDQVSWNRDLGVLWDRTRRRLRRLLGRTFAYALVRDPQERAALHVHCIIRVEGVLTVPAPTIARVAMRTTAQAFGRTVGWGGKADCHHIPSKEAALASQAGYLVKGLSHGAMPPYSGLGTAREQHIAKLGLAARHMLCSERCKGTGCKALAHRHFGAQKAVVTVSRNWSWTGLTRGGQRAARRAWAQSHGLGAEGVAA